ncbi:MAG: adenylate/guanylate cyclase domain-containing protein [Dehalococcoidia bacterium]
MEPRVQYARTSDGVNIAYTVFGEGPPLLVPPLLAGSHLQLEWSVPARRTTYERLAEHATVIRYDCRGTGMSQRDRIDFGPDAVARDMEAVMDAAGFNRAALFVVQAGAIIDAASWAVAGAEGDRINRVIFWIRRRADWAEVGRRLSRLEFLMEEDWELYTEIRTRLIAGWEHADAAPFAAMLRAGHSPESIRAADEMVMKHRHGSPSSMSSLSIPALILHPLGEAASSQVAVSLAAECRSGEVLGIPGQVVGPYPNEIGVAAIHEFIRAEALSPDGAQSIAHLDMGAAVKTVLFTDLEGHTEMMRRLGDARARDVLREHERVTREALGAHGGTEVKTMGDGFMASFGSPQRAIECAIALQRVFAAREIHGERLSVRAGINAGEPIAEEDDLFGSCVILASRTAARARGGEILVTDVVRQLAAGKGFVFVDRGDASLKGFEDVVRLFEVRWDA